MFLKIPGSVFTFGTNPTRGRFSSNRFIIVFSFDVIYEISVDNIYGIRHDNKYVVKLSLEFSHRFMHNAEKNTRFRRGHRILVLSNFNYYIIIKRK